MGKVSKKKQARINSYFANKEQCDKAFIRVVGALTALIEDIELANSVFPEIYPDSLVVGANATLNSLYSGKRIEMENEEMKKSISHIADVQNYVADLYRSVNESIN